MNPNAQIGIESILMVNSRQTGIPLFLLGGPNGSDKKSGCVSTKDQARKEEGPEKGAPNLKLEAVQNMNVPWLTRTDSSIIITSGLFHVRDGGRGRMVSMSQPWVP